MAFDVFALLVVYEVGHSELAGNAEVEFLVGESYAYVSVRLESVECRPFVVIILIARRGYVYFF